MKKYRINFFTSLIISISIILVNVSISSASDATFTLSDDSAYSKVWNTKYVRDLASKYPNVYIRIEGRGPEYRGFYLGFDEVTHTTGYDTLKVDKNGVVYRNEDRTQADEIWIVIQ